MQSAKRLLYSTKLNVSEVRAIEQAFVDGERAEFRRENQWNGGFSPYGGYNNFGGGYVCHLAYRKNLNFRVATVETTEGIGARNNDDSY